MHIILAGNGTYVYFLFLSLTKRGASVTVVDNHHEECTRLAQEQRGTILEGEYVFPNLLEEAGAHHADAVIALAPTDHENLSIGQLVLMRFHVPRALAIVNDPENEQVFTKFGIQTLSPVKMVTDLLCEKDSKTEKTDITDG